MTKFTRFVLVVAMVGLGLMGLHSSASAQVGNVVIPEGTPVTLGEPVEGQISAETPIVAYTFEGKEGDALTAYVEDETITVVYMIVADAEGEILYSTSFDPVYDYAARIMLYVLPGDGQYRIAVTSSNYFIYQEADDAASYTFTVDVADYQSIAYGETVDGTLSEENLVDLYVFEAEEGAIPYAILDSIDLDLALYSATNAEFDESQGNVPPESTQTYITPRFLMDDDVFYLMVGASYLFGDEAYSLTLNEYVPGTITGDAPVEIDLTVETLTNYLLFEGADDQMVTIEVTADEAINPTTVVFDPDSDVVAFAENGEAIKELELKEDGTYVIAILPGGYLISQENLGTVTVTLTVE